MKIAYLILAHHQPEHLGRLIRALQCDGAHFFIHVDAKSSEQEFKIATANLSNITFVPSVKREKVFWCGYGSVKAICALIDLALSFTPPFDRFCLLSGADFPISSTAARVQKLSAPLEFMCIWKRIDDRPTKRHTATMKNVTNIHLYDNWWLNPRTTPAKHATFYLNMLLRRIPISRRPRFPVYVGSAFWALSTECLRHIQMTLKTEKMWARLFRYSLVPDEMVFQTIVMNSPFRSRVVHDYSGSDNPDIQYTLREHGCHYIDWTAPNTRLPKVLRQDDFESLACSSMLFARKFDSAASAQLLDRLEKEIVGVEHRSNHYASLCPGLE